MGYGMRLAFRIALILGVVGLASLLVDDAAFSLDAPATRGGSVPSFESLGLATWQPVNDLRPVRRLEGTPPASVGFNEEFIWGYLQSQGVTCSDCSTNSPPVPLDVARSYLDLLSQNGVRTAREIVPERYLADASKYALFETILREYQQRNFTLILTLAWPVTGPQAECFGFDGDNAMFDRRAYEFSASIAGLLLHLQNRPNIDPKWLETRVLIEPWNEFDGLCGHHVGSPKKAARYQGIMQLVFDRSGIKNEVVMPSIVNVYKFDAPTAIKGRYGKMSTYLADYYASGGSGRPNIHLYFDPRWANQPEALAKILGSEIAKVAQSLPDPYKGALMIGETGVTSLSDVSKCNAFAMRPSSKTSLYQAMVENPDFSRNAQMILFWRLFGLEHLTREPDNCDQFNGMTSNAWSRVENPEQALGTFTETGLDLLKAARPRR